MADEADKAALRADFSRLRALAVTASAYLAEGLQMPDCCRKPSYRCECAKPSWIVSYEQAASVILDIHAIAQRYRSDP